MFSSEKQSFWQHCGNSFVILLKTGSLLVLEMLALRAMCELPYSVILQNTTK